MRTDSPEGRMANLLAWAHLVRFRLESIERRLLRLSSLLGVRPTQDPIVRADPPLWSGPSLVGRAYSECPSTFLHGLEGALRSYVANLNSEADFTKIRAAHRRLDLAHAWAIYHRVHGR